MLRCADVSISTDLQTSRFLQISSRTTTAFLQLPSTADQERICENEATDVTLVARVDFKRTTLESPRVFVDMVHLYISSLRQKKSVPVQL